MRNEEPDIENAQESGVARRSRRRRQAIIGAAGLTAVLGAGAIYATQAATDDDSTVRETGAMAPALPASSPTAAASVPAAAPSSAASVPAERSAQAVAPAPSPTRSLNTAEKKRVAAVRSAAATAGVPVQRALTPTAAAAAAGPVEVKNTGSLAKDGATMRVITAKYDLSGQRELLWAADAGKPVGDARCTQNFHFSNNRVAAERPTTLMCWRTSAGKSVITIAVVKEGRPPEATSIATLDKAWAALS